MVDYHAVANLERVQAILYKMQTDSREYIPHMIEKMIYVQVSEAGKQEYYQQMRKATMRLKLSDQQWDFLKSLGIEDRDYSQDEIDEVVIEVLSDELMRHGFIAKQKNVNEIGATCESIIDVIEEQRDGKSGQSNRNCP